MNKLQFGMTAEEARALGLEVPEDVPDVAILSPDLTKESEIKTEDGPNGEIIVNMKIAAKWSHINIKFEIEV